MDFLTRFKNALFLIAVLLAQAIALAVQVRTPADAEQPDGRSVRLIRMWATSTVTPFERAAHAIGSGTSPRLVGLHRPAPRAPAEPGSAAATHAHAHRRGRDRRGRDPGPAPAGAARLQRAATSARPSPRRSSAPAEATSRTCSPSTRARATGSGPTWRSSPQDGIVGKLRDVFPTTVPGAGDQRPDAQAPA